MLTNLLVSGSLVSVARVVLSVYAVARVVVICDGVVVCAQRIFLFLFNI